MQQKKHQYIEYEVYGRYALFSDPITRVGGEKTTYHIPTYEAVKGITESIYWKPTIMWIPDSIRIMNKIRTRAEGVRTIKYNGGNDLSCYVYLKDVRYQVRAHFEFNPNHPELKADRNYKKHLEIAKRSVQRGGRRDVYLGTRDCQAFVEPCVFGEGASYYDEMTEELDYGFMYHGITYADEAILPQEKGALTVNYWRASLKPGGYINFIRPEECKYKNRIKDMQVTVYKQAEEVGS